MITLLLCMIPLGEPITDQVDTIEINRVYDSAALHTFSQTIFRESDYSIIGWRILKHHSQYPQWMPNNRYEATWWDGSVHRRVRCRSVRETWTQHDREIAERADLPSCKRRGLTD